MRDPVVVALADRIAAAGVLLSCDLHAEGHRVLVDAVALGPDPFGRAWVVTYVCPATGTGGGRAGHVNQRQLPQGRAVQTLLLAGARLVFLHQRPVELDDADRAVIASRGPIGRAEALEVAVLGGDAPWQQQLAQEEIAQWLGRGGPRR